MCAGAVPALWDVDHGDKACEAAGRGLVGVTMLALAIVVLVLLGLPRWPWRL